MTARSLIAAVILAAVAAPAPAQISNNPKVRAPFKAVVERANESTVQIRGDDKDVALGTVVFSDGYILTKASELRGALSVRLSDGTEYDAKIVGKHRDTDLALLKVDVKDLKPITFTDSKKAVMGNWLAAAGPTSEPVAVGIVSVITRKLTFPDDLIDNHNRGYLGILLSQTDPKDADGKVLGAKITSVEAKGAGKKAGLKENDVIVAVEGAKVLGRAALRDALEDSRPGESVTLTVLREIREGEEKKTEEKQFTIKLTGPVGPPDRSTIQNAMGGDLSGRRTGFPAILQTDMYLEPKNCGGPVVDLDGNVLGISIARAGRVETWILPGENIRPLLADLKAGKFAPIVATKKEEKKEEKKDDK
jgi:serine protease Do